MSMVNMYVDWINKNPRVNTPDYKIRFKVKSGQCNQEKIFTVNVRTSTNLH